MLGSSQKLLLVLCVISFDSLVSLNDLAQSFESVVVKLLVLEANKINRNCLHRVVIGSDLHKHVEGDNFGELTHRLGQEGEQGNLLRSGEELVGIFADPEGHVEEFHVLLVVGHTFFGFGCLPIVDDGNGLQLLVGAESQGQNREHHRDRALHILISSLLVFHVWLKLISHVLNEHLVTNTQHHGGINYSSLRNVAD